MSSAGAAATLKNQDGSAVNAADSDNQPKENASFSVSGASVLTMLAAGGVGIKHRIYKLTITADTAGTLTISDGFGAIYHVANRGLPFIDFGIAGHLQDTANTAITITNSGGGNVSAHGAYKSEGV